MTEADARVIDAPYGRLPDLAGIDGARDLVMVWNGTTSGVRLPNADFIPTEREGLVICDATSAAFAQPLDWSKLDAITFSWQKALGGEAAHGVLILGPRAVERLESYTPAWPLPKIFRMTNGGKLIEGIFEGETINTPSMLVIEDYIFGLEWAKEVGGLAGMIARSQANAAALNSIVSQLPWLDHLVADPAIRSNTSVCLKFADGVVEGMDEAARLSLVKKLAATLEAEDVAYDIAGHRDAPAGLRIWCGATVDADDVEKLGPWLDWAWHSIRS